MLLAMAIAFSFFGIAITLALSVFERTREIGLLREGVRVGALRDLAAKIDLSIQQLAALIQSTPRTLQRKAPDDRLKIEPIVLGQGVVLERNEDYYDPERPKLDKVTITLK